MFVPYFSPLPVIYLFPPLAAHSCCQLLKSLNKFKYLKLPGVLTSSKENYPSCPYLPLPDSLVVCQANPGLSAEILADEMQCSEVSTQQKWHQPVQGSFSFLNSLSPRQLSVTVSDHCRQQAGGEHLPPAPWYLRALCFCQCHFHAHRDELEIRAGVKGWKENAWGDRRTQTPLSTVKL